MLYTAMRYPISGHAVEFRYPVIARFRRPIVGLPDSARRIGGALSDGARCRSNDVRVIERLPAAYPLLSYRPTSGVPNTTYGASFGMWYCERRWTGKAVKYFTYDALSLFVT